MKKIICCSILLLVLEVSSLSLIAQTVNVDQGALVFQNKSEYESLVLSTDVDKARFYNDISGLSGFYSLGRAIMDGRNSSSIPDSVVEDVDFVLNVFNNEAVVGIGDYFYKIIYDREIVYVLHKNKANLYFNDLLTGNVTIENEMGYFNLESDAIEFTEAGYKTEPSLEGNDERIFCWHRGAAKNDHMKPAIYFLDESNLEYSTFTFCVNGAAQGVVSANTRLLVKLRYLRLGIYFTLYAKGKLQREDNVAVNGDPVWNTKDWGTGEGRWQLNYKAKYKGKCRNENEVNQEGTLAPPLNDKNKTGKVFWEKMHGLNYYCLEVTADLFTKRAFIGPGNETYFCTEPQYALALSAPRMVRSTEIYSYQAFKISSRIECR
jgi:hypothetical protein